MNKTFQVAILGCGDILQPKTNFENECINFEHALSAQQKQLFREIKRKFHENNNNIQEELQDIKVSVLEYLVNIGFF